MPTRTVHAPAELEVLAREVLEQLPQTDSAQVLALRGDLGAGKTTFVQALGRVLGITEHIVSPTFVIMRVYETGDERFLKLVHIDAYRVEDEREIEVLRIPELFSDAHTLVCIEWPERISSLMPKDVHNIFFTTMEGDAREVTYGS